MEKGVDEMTSQQVTEGAIKIAERFGVPFLVLLAMLWMVREAATGLHQTVVVPIVKSHTEFLAGTRETLREISTTQSQQAEALREIAVGQLEIRRAILSDGKK
jgi:hypothetical protein